MNIGIIKCTQDCIQINSVETIEIAKKKIEYQIENILYEHIIFEKIPEDNSNDGLLEIISKHLDICQVVMTYNCYSTYDYLYQTIFIEGNNDSKNINYLGTQLSNGIIAIDTVIIIKNKIIDNNTCKLASLTENDVKEIIISKFIKKGISVSTDGDTTTFEYMQSPLEKYSYDKCKENHRYSEMKIYNCILGLYYEIDSRDKLNETAMLICDKKVNGNILFTLSIEDWQCNGIFNLDLEENYFEKLKKLLSIKNYISSYDKYENTKFANIHRCIDNEYLLMKNNIDIKSIQEIIDNSETLNKII
jgi:hypothetical protein